MIDEKDIKDIIELIENSSQRIRDMKKYLKEKSGSLMYGDGDATPLGTELDRVIREGSFDNIYMFLQDIEKNISFKMNLLKVQYNKLDENINKIQELSKEITNDDVNLLSEITETFFYKFKILQNIVFDISTEIQNFSGKGAEYFLKNLRTDCVDFDEKFEQIVRDLIKNSKITTETIQKLSKLDSHIDIEKELSDINISMNAIMSSISVFDQKYQDLGRAFEDSGIYKDFSFEIKDLSYNTKNLIKSMDNFNKVIEENMNIVPVVSSLSDDIDDILLKLNDILTQTQNKEQEQAIFELKEIISNQNNDEIINKIQELLSPALQKDDEAIKLNMVQIEDKLNELFKNIQIILNERNNVDLSSLDENFSRLEEISVCVFQNIEKTERLLNFFEGEDFKNLNNIYLELQIINEKVDELASLSTKLENKFDVDSIQNTLSDTVSSQIKENFLSSVEVAQNTIKYEISNSFVALEAKFQETIENLSKTPKMDDFVAEINQIFEGKMQQLEFLIKSIDNVEEFSEIRALLHQFNEEKHSFANEFLGSFLNIHNETKSELSQVVYSANQNLKDDIVQVSINNTALLQEKLENLEFLIKSFDNTEDISELRDVLHQFEEIKISLVSQIENTLASSKEQLQGSFDLLKNDVFEQVEQNKNTILDNIDGQNNNLIALLESQKDLFESQNSLILTQETFAHKLYSSKEELIQNISNIQEFLQNELSQMAENNKNAIQEDFDNLLSKSLYHQNDIKQSLETIQNLYQEKSLEVSQNQEAVAHSLEQLFMSQIDNKNELAGAIEGAQNNIKEELEIANAKLSSNNNELVNNIQELKHQISGNINEIVSLLNNQEIGKIIESINHIKNVLQESLEKMDSSSQFKIDFMKEKIQEAESSIKNYIFEVDPKNQIEELKKGLDEINQNLIMQVIQIFDNISFEQETQDIKDYVADSYNNMKNVVSNLKSNMDKLLEAPSPIYIEELQKEVHRISQFLENMGPAMPDYVKSLADIGNNIQNISDTKNIILNVENLSNQFKNHLEELLNRANTQDEVKNGVDNLNLSINYVNENLNSFLGEYRIFQDKFLNTTQNLETMMGNFSKMDNMNAEYKAGVNEAFKDLKGDLNQISSGVQAIYGDVNKVVQATNSIIDTEKTSNDLIFNHLDELRKVIEASELNKIQDRFSTIIFSLNGFMNSFDEKFGNLLNDSKASLDLAVQNNEILKNVQKTSSDLILQNSTVIQEIKNNANLVQNLSENINLPHLENILQDKLQTIQNDLIANFNETNSNLENGIISVNNSIRDLQVDNLSNKINDEFLAISKKLDIDFFDFHKKIIDEFLTIQESLKNNAKESNNQISDNFGNILEKFNGYSSSIKNAIESNLQQVISQLNASQSETKEQKESILNTIDYLKAEVLNNLVSSVEKVANRLDEQNFALKNIEDTKILLSQLINEQENQKDSEKILKELEKYKQEFENLENILNYQKQVFAKETELNKEISQNIEQILDKVDIQTGLSFKNMEQTKDYLTEMAIGFDNQSSWLVKVITDYQDELEQIIVRFDMQAKTLVAQEEKINSFEEKIEIQEKKLESIDKKLDLILSKLASSNNSAQ